MQFYTNKRPIKDSIQVNSDNYPNIYLYELAREREEESSFLNKIKILIDDEVTAEVDRNKTIHLYCRGRRSCSLQNRLTITTENWFTTYYSNYIVQEVEDSLLGACWYTEKILLLYKNQFISLKTLKPTPEEYIVDLYQRKRVKLDLPSLLNELPLHEAFETILDRTPYKSTVSNIQQDDVRTLTVTVTGRYFQEYAKYVLEYNEATQSLLINTKLDNSKTDFIDRLVQTMVQTINQCNKQDEYIDKDCLQETVPYEEGMPLYKLYN